MTVPLDDRTSLYTAWGDWLGISCLAVTIGLVPMSFLKRGARAEGLDSVLLLTEWVVSNCDERIGIAPNALPFLTGCAKCGLETGEFIPDFIEPKPNKPEE